MAHIIILDEFGNEIGREEHDPGTPGGGFAGSPDHFSEDEGDHAPVVVRLNIGEIIRLHGIKAEKKKKDE